MTTGTARTPDVDGDSSSHMLLFLRKVLCSELIIPCSATSWPNFSTRFLALSFLLMHLSTGSSGQQSLTLRKSPALCRQYSTPPQTLSWAGIAERNFQSQAVRTDAPLRSTCRNDACQLLAAGLLSPCPWSSFLPRRTSPTQQELNGSETSLRDELAACPRPRPFWLGPFLLARIMPETAIVSAYRLSGRCIGSLGHPCLCPSPLLQWSHASTNLSRPWALEEVT